MDLSITEVTRETAPREFLASHHGLDSAQTATVSKAAFGGNSIEAGTAIGEITESGLFGPYDAAATDGRETAKGLTLNPVTFGADDEAFVAYIVRGDVIEENLPAEVDAAGKADLPGIVFV